MTAAPPSAHARYRARLAALRADEAILPPVLRAAARLSLADGDGRLERDYARFHPDRDPFATLVLRDLREPVLRVEAYDSRPVAATPEAAVESDAGWLRVSPLASDPALRSLAGLLARPGRHTVVRYRPRRRCTVRFDADAGSSYAKVFADRRGERIAEEGGALWAAAQRGELGFAVPRPQRYDPAGRTLWQAGLPGRPAGAALLHPAGTAVARAMGRALASLARAHLAPRRVLTPAALHTRAARLGRSLVRSVPGTERDVYALLARLRDAHAGAAAAPLGPVHGNPNPTQWLVHPLAWEAGLGLVDFDGLALGQPELDAVAVTAALEFEDPARVPVARLRAAFLAGYRESGGQLDTGLMAVYRAHRRFAKAVRVATSLRPDGDVRAGRHLERALRELDREAA